MSPYRVDARLSGRHPFEIYLLFLAMMVSLPTMLGIIPRPDSIQALLPTWLAFGWAWVMFSGSFAALIGIYLPDRAWGLILEQLGLAFVGIMSIVYAVGVAAYVGMDGLLTIAMVGGFGVSCLRRYLQIQTVLDQVHEVEKRSGRA